MYLAGDLPLPFALDRSVMQRLDYISAKYFSFEGNLAFFEWITWLVSSFQIIS